MADNFKVKRILLSGSAVTATGNNLYIEGDRLIKASETGSFGGGTTGSAGGIVGFVVYQTGNQLISGIKTGVNDWSFQSNVAFTNRPTVNGTGVLLSGEASVGSSPVQAGYDSFSVSSSVDNTINFTNSESIHSTFITGAAGGAAYTARFVLPTITSSGSMLNARVELTDSENPIIQFKNINVGGSTLLTVSGIPSTLSSVAAQFYYNNSSWVLLQAGYDS